MGCRGISALMPRALPPLLLHCPWCLQGSSSRIFSSLLSFTAAAPNFSLILQYLIPEVPLGTLRGSALTNVSSVLEPARTGSAQNGGSSWSLLTETTPAGPQLPKPCHVNPIHKQRNIRTLSQNLSLEMTISRHLWPSFVTNHYFHSASLVQGYS